ncbi:MAG: hypothetical protein H6509_05745 [Bryobacterales bacterium]|nr:hypothetical protein [Acidobacteriota bacterium]MCB9384097.1 hypothetical protein [Bryobacterales bacterium]
MSSPNDESPDVTRAEIRRDLRGDPVIVSPGRAGRPYDFRGDQADRRRTCPFCAGREDQTPPEVDAIRQPGSQPDQPGWSVRVVPNRYPAVPRHAEGQGLWGLHEVVIETPEHDRSLADLSVEQTADVLRIFERRLRAARSTDGIEYACIFKNHGPEAGASLEHSHSQLLAVPFVPRRIAEEAETIRRGEFLRRLREARPVAESQGLKAFCPPDARMPYEVWIAPVEPAAAFEDAPEELTLQAAEMLHGLLGAMNAILERPPYHLLLYTAPFAAPDGFHWRIEIAPRMARIAGFELATGVFVNQTDPARATEDYRRALGDH